MNEQTTKLLEQLAIKLGTTVEYLWSVLVNQAQINAIINIILFIGVIISGIGLYQAFIKLVKRGAFGYDAKDIKEAMSVIVIIASFIWIIFMFIAIFSIPSIINGFLNPEYWAFKQVLNCID